MKQATVEQNATRNWIIPSLCMLQNMKECVLERAPWVWPDNHFLKRWCIWLIDPINYPGRNTADLYRRGQRWGEVKEGSPITGFHWLRGYGICLQCSKSRFDPWVGKTPWRREWLPTPVFLLGEFHGQRSLEDCRPWGRKELDTAERLTLPYTKK